MESRRAPVVVRGIAKSLGLASVRPLLLPAPGMPRGHLHTIDPGSAHCLRCLFRPVPCR